MTGILAAQSLLAWFVEQLAFIAMYQVALVAVMLTGNILTALLGCAGFFSYELAVRFLIDELKTMFFASYCSADARQWMQKSYLTPFAGFWDLLNHIWYRDEGRLCSYKNAGGWGRDVGVECILLLRRLQACLHSGFTAGAKQKAMSMPLHLHPSRVFWRLRWQCPLALLLA